MLTQMQMTELLEGDRCKRQTKPFSKECRVKTIGTEDTIYTVELKHQLEHLTQKL